MEASVPVTMKNELRAIPYNGVLFFVSRADNDREIGALLTDIVARSSLRQSGYGALVAPQAWLHGNIARFLWALQEVVALPLPEDAPAETLALGEKLRERWTYLQQRRADWGVNEIGHWYSGIIIDKNRPGIAEALVVLIEETIDELRRLAPGLAGASAPADEGAMHLGPAIEDHVPASVLALRTEAFLPVIRPWFQKSLAVPGDVAEFGCFKGTMSIKYAYYLRSLKQDKTVYAFDTFEGFTINDPGGGALGIGAYANNDNAFDELTRWSKAIPVVPVRGDATQTCKVLTKPMSFVWLDLDMGVLMEPVLQHVRHLCTKETVIGVDDYGRPETPTIKPWADETEKSGIWTKLQDYPESSIAFYRICD